MKSVSKLVREHRIFLLTKRLPSKTRYLYMNASW